MFDFTIITFESLEYLTIWHVCIVVLFEQLIFSSSHNISSRPPPVKFSVIPVCVSSKKIKKCKLDK